MNLVEALQFWAELEPVEYLEGRELSAIEYAVREAIEARTLDWRVWHRYGLDYGEVSFLDREALLNQWSKASSSSAAHALLLAYIAYLETLVNL